MVVPWVLLAGALVFALVVTLAPPFALDNPELYGEYVGRQCALYAPDVTWWAVTESDQRLLNVALFVPIGLMTVLAARTLRCRSGVLTIGATLLLPVGIETVQWAFPALLRACDANDLADNYTGHALGLAVGELLVGLRWAARRESGRVAP